MTDVWKQVFSTPFSKTSGCNRIPALAELGGKLFVGTGRASIAGSAKVFCLENYGSTQWADVTPPWSSATTGSSLVMAVFQNELYVGTDQGEIFRTSDGVKWTDVTANLPPGSMIDAMAVFGTDFYISSGATIYRRSMGNSWLHMVSLSSKEPRLFDLHSLEVFQGNLYAGVGLNFYTGVTQRKGIQLWRTGDGKNWSKFQEVVEPSTGRSGYFYPEHVHALRAFGGYLYVGEYHGSGLYRTDGSSTSWEYIADAISQGSGSVFRLVEHSGKLYLGVSHLASPDAPGDPGSVLLYVSMDGSKWNPVSGSPTVGSDCASIMSLLSWEGRLFVGTHSVADSGLVVMWELGPVILADKLESNNTFDTATLIKLGPTKGCTSAQLSDLTLHDGNDVDYFAIDYQSQPECECPNILQKGKPSGGGPFYLELHPGMLSIHAQEEYSLPLDLEVYDSQRNPKGKWQTSAAVDFTCPTDTFQDRKLFLRVSHPKAQPPVRYKLTVTYCNSYGTWALISGALEYAFWEYLPPPYPPPPFLEFFDPAIRHFDVGQLVADAEAHIRDFIEFRNRILEANLKHSVGALAHQAGLYDDAEVFYGQSLAFFEEVGAAAKHAEVLRHLGELYSSQGKADEALMCLEKAVQIHETLENARGLAFDQASLGRHYLAQGEASKALTALDDALGLQIEYRDSGELVLNLLDQAEAFLALEQPDATIACLVLAEKLSSRVNDPALGQDIVRRIELMTAKTDERQYLEFKKRPAGEAETVRQQVMSQLTGK